MKFVKRVPKQIRQTLKVHSQHLFPDFYVLHLHATGGEM